MPSSKKLTPIRMAMPSPNITKNPIPEPLNNRLRNRFRLLRQLSGKFRHSFPWISSSTINNWEQHDISGMKLRDIVLLSEALGMSPVDFVSSLFSDDGFEVNSIQGRRITRLNRSFLDLSDDYQVFALRLMDQIEAMCQSQDSVKDINDKNYANAGASTSTTLSRSKS